MSSDPELVAAAQAGDTAALDTLLRRHYDRVHALCRRLAGNESDALDATQEALLAVVRGLPRFDGRAAFTTWLYRVATNACLDELRRRRRRPEPRTVDDEHEDVTASGPPTFDQSIADRLAIDEALAGLAEDFRVAVVLRDVVGPRLRGDRDGSRRAAGNRSLANRTGARRAGATTREPERGHQRRKGSAMTDPRPPDEDELVSRVLDGDATADERARVARDPRLQARVRDFERVQTALADVEPASAAVRDDAIAAAMAEVAPVAATDDRVRSDLLAYTRGRRRRRIATVVAVAAALLIGVPLLAIALTGRGTEQKSASTAGDAVAAQAPGETLGPQTGGHLQELGAIGSEEELRAALVPVLGPSNADAATRLQASAGTLPSVPLEPVPADKAIDCVDLELTRDGFAVASYAAHATWQGESAVVAVFDIPSTPVVVVMRDDCTVVARFPG